MAAWTTFCYSTEFFFYFFLQLPAVLEQRLYGQLVLYVTEARRCYRLDFPRSGIFFPCPSNGCNLSLSRAVGFSQSRVSPPPPPPAEIFFHVLATVVIWVYPERWDFLRVGCPHPTTVLWGWVYIGFNRKTVFLVWPKNKSILISSLMGFPRVISTELVWGFSEWFKQFHCHFCQPCM